MKDNERQEIEKFGQLQENGIFTMTIIGEIEGHQLSAQNAKTTKYEHMIPALAKVEQDESIKGILILINTIGGDVECGLAIAELIASLSKPYRLFLEEVIRSEYRLLWQQIILLL